MISRDMVLSTQFVYFGCLFLRLHQWLLNVSSQLWFVSRLVYNNVVASVVIVHVLNLFAVVWMQELHNYAGEFGV